MKKYLHILTLSFLAVSLYAQTDIVHTDFGDGWAIPLNANEGVDMDEDGTIDLYFNKATDQLGVTGVFDVGCFTSDTDNVFNELGTATLFIHEQGDFIQLDNGNWFDYIEGDGSLYDPSDDLFLDNVTDSEEFFIGVALMQGPGPRNGWIKMEINAESEMLIVKEWAYRTTGDFGQGGILAGDTGALTSIAELVNISDITVSPNPVADRMRVTYDYTGQEDLSISIYNAVGQEVYQDNLLETHATLEINTDNWIGGTHIIRFETPSGIKTKQVMVIK